MFCLQDIIRKVKSALSDQSDWILHFSLLSDQVSFWNFLINTFCAVCKSTGINENLKN